MVGAIIDELNQKGWQSDARSAESFIRSRIEKGYGLLRLRHELWQRGLESVMLDNFIDKNAIDWMAVAERAYRKKYGEILPGDKAEIAKRSRFLQQRGFSPTQIRLLFDRLKRSG